MRQEESWGHPPPPTQLVRPPCFPERGRTQRPRTGFRHRGKVATSWIVPYFLSAEARGAQYLMSMMTVRGTAPRRPPLGLGNTDRLRPRWP